MADSTIWWLLVGAAVAVELVTGTFYLLMISIGMAAAALAAHAGASLTVQLVTAAVLGGGSVAAWRSYKLRQPSPPQAGANRDVNLDIGETVQVDAWLPNGTSSIKYRGAQWNVALESGSSATPGTHTIVEVVGNRLILRKN